MTEEFKPHRRTKYDDYHKSKILKKKKVTFAQEILNQVIDQEESKSYLSFNQSIGCSTSYKAGEDRVKQRDK